MRRLRAVYERDRDRAWTVRIPAIRGCHTYGRTLEQARSRIREALRLWVDDPDAVSLTDDVRLPADLRRTLARVERARQRARAQQVTAQQELRAAALLLERAGLSRRDAGTLLGLSRQRVQQLGGRARLSKEQRLGVVKAAAGAWSGRTHTGAEYVDRLRSGRLGGLHGRKR